MYQTNIANNIYNIDSYTIDENETYNSGTALVLWATFNLGSGGTSLLYYHPGSKPNDVKETAKVLYRGLKLLTSKTPAGIAMNTIMMINKADVIEEMIFSHDHAHEGYYKYQSPKNCIIRGKLNSNLFVQV